MKALAKKTVPELREACKKAGITGYSKMTKDALMAALGAAKKAKTAKAKPKKATAKPKAAKAAPKKGKRGYAAKTVVELREMCKKRGITGFTKMKRDDLIAALKGGAVAAPKAAKPKAHRVIPYSFMITSSLLDGALKAAERENYSKSIAKVLTEMFAGKGERKEYAKLIFSYSEKYPDINLRVLLWKKGAKYICFRGFTDDEGWKEMSQAAKHTSVRRMVGLMMVADEPTAFHSRDYLAENREFAKVWRRDVLKGASTPTVKYVM